jgi:hypothetical protein
MTATLSNRSVHGFRTLTIAFVALIGTSIGFAATTSPVRAETGAYYTAKLATPVKSLTHVALGDTVWSCEGGECHAPRDTSRTVITCERLATKFGGVASFTAQGGALGDEDLTKCNHKVSGGRVMLGSAAPKR